MIVHSILSLSHDVNTKFAVIRDTVVVGRQKIDLETVTYPFSNPFFVVCAYIFVLSRDALELTLFGDHQSPRDQQRATSLLLIFLKK